MSKRSPMFWFSTVVMCAIFFSALRWLLAQSGPDRIADSTAQLYFTFFCGLYCSILVHEIGHLLAGLACGMRLRMFQVAGIAVRRGAKGFRIERYKIPGAGGVVLMHPRDENSLDRSAMIRFIIGGPLANIVLAGVVGLIAVASFPGSISPSIYAALLALAAENVWIGVANLVPFNTSSGMMSDGKTIQTLRRQTPAADRIIAILMIQRAIFASVRPRGWSQAWVDRLVFLGDGSIQDIAALSYKIGFLSDTLGEQAVDAEMEHLQAVLADSKWKTNPIYQLAIIDVACFQALKRGNADDAEEWLKRVDSWHSAAKPSLKLVEAACHLARREYSEAIEAANKHLIFVEDSCKKYGFDSEYSREYTLKLIARAKAESDETRPILSS